MKLLIIISLFIILVLLGGRISDDNEYHETGLDITPLPSPSSLQFNNPESITIVECNFYGDKNENLDWKEIWPRIIEDRYDIEFNIVTPDRENYMDTIYKAAKTGELTGIVEIFGGPYLEELKEMDLIHPLSEFLKDNDIWNTVIPEEWKNTLTLEGDIWAVPSGSDGMSSWLTRSMRGDWLDKLGLEIPYTLDEFYEVSYMFTYNDPNQNGKNDTVGLTGSDLIYLHDIFSAFDARLSSNGKSTLTWNPNTNLWEDSMQKPEMIECLEYLNKCYDDRIIDREIFSGLTNAEVRNRMSSGFYGSTFYWDSWALSFESRVKELFPDAYMICIGGLVQNISRNLNYYFPSSIGSPRVLMKNTLQPNETINWFINTFFGDEWGFWTGRLGPVGEYPGQADRVCTISQKTILRNTYIDQDNSIRTYPGPGFIGGLPSKALYTVYEVAYHVPKPPDGYENWATDTADHQMDNMKRRKGWMEEYIENGMLYLLPDNLREPSSEDYWEYRNDIIKATRDSITAAIIGEISIDDAIDMYEKAANTFGINKIINIENDKLRNEKGN